MVSRSPAGSSPGHLSGSAHSRFGTALSRSGCLRRTIYICIEVLSPDDTFPRLQERLDDYLSMGAPNIWLLDPVSRRGWSITRRGHLEALDGVLRTTDEIVMMPIKELFESED